MSEPFLGKRKPRMDSYKPMTWQSFLKLEEAAQKAANATGYPVYLVGSATYVDVPRDIDISVILPESDFEAIFGIVPDDQKIFPVYLGWIFQRAFPWLHDLHFCIDYDLDIKVCPDTWWPDKPKMLLAAPNGEA